MKNFFLTLSLLVTSFSSLLFFVPTLATAQTTPGVTPPANQSTAHIDSQTDAFAGARGAGYVSKKDPRLVVAEAIKIALSLVGVVFLGYALYAGMVILTSRGDTAKVDKGKDTLRTAIMGIVVIIAAYGITAFVTTTILQHVLDDGSAIEFQRLESEPNRDPLNPETPELNPSGWGTFYIEP